MTLRDGHWNKGVTDAWVIDLRQMEIDGTLDYYLERVLRHDIEPTHRIEPDVPIGEP